MFVGVDLLISELPTKLHNYPFIHERNTLHPLVKHDLHSGHYRLRIIDNILFELSGQNFSNFPLDKDFVVLVKEIRLSS